MLKIRKKTRKAAELAQVLSLLCGTHEDKLEDVELNCLGKKSQPTLTAATVNYD